MKWAVFFCLIITFFSCKEDDFKGLGVQDDPSITSINGTWKVIAYEDYQQEEIITKTEENSWGLNVIITFDDTTDPPDFGGRNTLNYFSASFEYTGQRSIQTSSLSFGPTSTLSIQSEWGDKFNAVLFESELQFAIRTTHLKIYNEPKQLSVIFEKE